MSLITIALIVLTLTALGGVAAAAFRARGSNPPMWLGTVHGVAAASGLILLVAAGLVDGFGTALAWGLGILVVSALGGFVLYGTHLRKKLISGPLVVVHASISVTGFVFVAVAALA